MIGLAIGSDGFELICREPPGRRRPLDAAMVAILESYRERHDALLATDDATPGLLALGQELYRFLDGEAGALTALIDRAPRPLQFGIVCAAAEPSRAELSLLHAPWELLADDRGFLAADDALGFRLVRRLGRGQPLATESAITSEQGGPAASGDGPSPSNAGAPASRNASAGGRRRRSGSAGDTLTSSDWRAMLALVGEVGEIASSASAQPHAHLTAELSKLIGAGPVWWYMVGGAAGPEDTSGPVIRSYVHGLTPEDMQRWEQSYLRELAYEAHPMWPRAFATPGHARSFLRRDLVEDGVWYRSAHIADWSRSFGFDDVVSAIVPIGGGAELCIATMRPWGDRTFGGREREMMRLLTTHTAWLGRRPDPLAQAARSGNGAAEAANGLAPRHRAMLELLLTGQSEKEIAVALQVSPRTAHKYVEQIYRAFEVSSRAELMARFIAR
jgi:DNA-binding CsgD family transcriptional regulator